MWILQKLNWDACYIFILLMNSLLCTLLEVIRLASLLKHWRLFKDSLVVIIHDLLPADQQDGFKIIWLNQSFLSVDLLSFWLWLRLYSSKKKKKKRVNFPVLNGLFKSQQQEALNKSVMERRVKVSHTKKIICSSTQIFNVYKNGLK